MYSQFMMHGQKNIKLRRILGNQSVRLRGGWHRLRTVPMTGFLISNSEPVGPATSADRCVYLAWRQGKQHLLSWSSHISICSLAEEILSLCIVVCNLLRSGDKFTSYLIPYFRPVTQIIFTISSIYRHTLLQYYQFAFFC